MSWDPRDIAVRDETSPGYRYKASCPHCRDGHRCSGETAEEAERAARKAADRCHFLSITS